MNIALQNLQHKYPIPTKTILQASQKVCHWLKLKHQEISIVFVGPLRMRHINKKYLNHDYETDVITFDLDQGAEIIICPKIASTQAKLFNQRLSDELLLYVVHGLLHLAGFDDHDPKDIKTMRLMETKLINKLNA